jgi:hypothetical protein
MFHAEADVWHAIIDLNLVRSITFLLCLLNKDGAVASAAKTSAPVAGSSSSSSGSSSGVAGFSVGFAGADVDDGVRLLSPSGLKLMPLRRLRVGFLLLRNIKLLKCIVSPDAPQHLSGSRSGGAGAGAGGMSSHSVESIRCMTGGIWSMPK